MKKPLIFVTNDDGHRAKGFNEMLNLAKKFGRVIAVAPETTQSGKSHAISMYEPLFINKVREEEDLVVYSCTGYPVDCVKVAFDHIIADEKPDLALSGINHGSNAAICVLYSGTMGAAIEANLYDIPSVGLSLTSHDPDADFSAAVYYGELIIKSLLESGENLCLNVNVPELPLEEIKGVKACRMTKSYFREEFVARTDPQGRNYMWLTGEFINSEPEAQDCDDWAVNNGYVSVVPIKTDPTDYERLEMLKKIIK